MSIPLDATAFEQEDDRQYIDDDNVRYKLVTYDSAITSLRQTVAEYQQARRNLIVATDRLRAVLNR